MIKYEAGQPLFASGRNTGNYVAGNVARLRTPIKVNYNIESEDNYKDVSYKDVSQSLDGLNDLYSRHAYSRFMKSPQPHNVSLLSNAG